MRKRAKLDVNHLEIVATLRKCGASVVSLASVGGGVPDLLVGYARQTCIMEIKDGDKPPSQRALTEDQLKFHRDWRGGMLVVVDSVDAALRVLKVMHGNQSL